MFPNRAIRRLSPSVEGMDRGVRGRAASFRAVSVALALFMPGLPATAAILWSDSGSTLAYNSGAGRDILEGSLKRDDTSSDTLYFKFHVDPLSDSTTEEYFAAFELFEGETMRVGIGNHLAAWAYSAFFRIAEPEGADPTTSYVDLRSSAPGASGSGAIPNSEMPRRGVERTVVFKVQYVPGGEDLVTLWLNPDLSPGATEVLQPDTLSTRFSANASFDEIRLRHGGGGEGWVFSDLAIATSFIEFVDPSSAVPRTAASSPVLDESRFHFQTWYREPGMPNNAIQALAQTADGYLWLAGRDQVARFDGVRFVGLDLPTALGGCAVQILFGDSHGALWIGTDRGLARHAGGLWKVFTTEDGLPANAITALAEDQEGRVWIGTRSGLATFHLGAIQSVEGLEQLEESVIKALFLEPTGISWIGVEGQGVFRYQQGALSLLTDPRVDALLQDPQCLLVDEQGRLWLGAGDDFVLCRDDDGWHRYRIPSSSRAPHVRALGLQTDGTVWAGSASEGLFHFKQRKLVAMNSRAGLLDDQISALLRDRDGNFWVGGRAGLHLLRKDDYVKLGKAEGLVGAAVAGLAEVAPGVIWAVQPGRGLLRWEGRSFRRLTAAGLDPSDPSLGAVLVARDGGCWVACTNGLLLFRDPQAVADESLFFELPEASITALEEDEDGSVWAGTREGQLWRLHRGQWMKHLRLDRPVAITALAMERDGLIWVATDGDGLYLVDDPIHAQFNTSDGLLSDSIRALHRDTEGRLWIGTDGGGMAGLSNQVLTSYTTGEGLPDNHVLGILEDEAGRLWVNDASGLACLSKPALSGRQLELLGVYPIAVGGVDNPSGSRSGAGMFPKGCRDDAGRLWFATVDGVLVVDPPGFRADITAPTLVLEEVLVDGVAAEGFAPIRAQGQASEDGAGTSPQLRIGPGKHRVELRYTGLRLESPEKLRFRYRMEGLDEDWVEAGPGRTALYSYLPPGDYRFAVAVEGPNGRSSRTSVGLSVSRYFWQQWWVIGATALGLLVVIGGGARFAEKRKLHHRLIRLEQEHALERERTRIAQDLHDEMGAKLCRISYLSEHAGRLDPDSGEIREQISNIAADSRELLHSLDEIVWVVNPHNDTLEHVASYISQYAQNYFHGTGIECELDIPSHLPPQAVSSQTRHHLFLAVHEAQTNVLKHSGATQVKVSIACNGSLLSIQVADNGGGGARPLPETEAESGETSGNGLRNMQQRMESIGGKCRMESAPGRGTTVGFELELKRPRKGRLNT